MLSFHVQAVQAVATAFKYPVRVQAAGTGAGRAFAFVFAAVAPPFDAMHYFRIFPHTFPYRPRK